jgi:hypothetical protein
MAFEVMLEATRWGAPREVRNPFTGGMVTSCPAEPSEAELGAMRAVLVRAGATLDDDGGGFLALPRARLELYGPDAGLVKVSGDLESACVVLFDLATAGHLSISAPNFHEDEPVLVTTADALARLEQAPAAGPAIVIANASELARRLAPHQAAALRYAAHVT